MSKIEEAILKANLERNRRERAVQVQALEPETPPQPKKTGRIFVLTGIVLAFIAGGAASRYLFGSVTTPQPVLSSAVPVKAPAQQSKAAVSPSSPDAKPGRTMPRCIPVDSRDPDYAANHPGWERYLGSDLEYRVFRKESLIKAIQVIVRNGAVIEQSKFASFMREAAGTSEHRITGHEERNEMLVDRGTAGGNTELLVYRAKPGGEIRAFVLEYP